MVRQDVCVGMVPAKRLDSFKLAFAKTFINQVDYRPATREGFYEVVARELKNERLREQMATVIRFFNGSVVA